jgi:hypothetical protein
MSTSVEERLALELASAVTPLLRRSHRQALWVQVGAGDYRSAIQDVLQRYAVSHTPLPDTLLQLANAWLNGYAGCDLESHIRCLLERIDPRPSEAAVPPEVTVRPDSPRDRPVRAYLR